MTEKGRRACRSAIGTRHENSDSVTDVGAWQHNLIAQLVERGAQTPDDIHGFSCGGTEFVRDGDRVIAPNDRPEVATGGKLMMQATICDEERLATAFLAIDNTHQIHAAFTDQPATELDGKTAHGQAICPVRKRVAKPSADQIEIDRHFVGEIGTASTARIIAGSRVNKTGDNPAA